MSSCSFTNKFSTKHRWVIHDFKDYFDVTCVREKHVLLSSSFSMHKYCNQFRIELSLYSQSKTKQSKPSKVTNWLSLSIREDVLTKSTQQKMIKYRVYCLNNKNLPCNFHETKIITENAADWSWPQFCDLANLYNEEKNLLSNNTLTIVCDVFVYDKNSDNNITYPNNPNFSINNDLSQLLESGEYTDVTFIFDDGNIKAHKLILMARSSVFKSMFSDDFDGAEYELIINDIDFKIFKSMIKFIYTDKLDRLSRDDVLKLTKAALKYDLKNLLDTCGKYFHTSITINNVMETLKLAENYNIENLKTYTIDFIKANRQNILNTLNPDYFKNNPNHASIFLF